MRAWIVGVICALSASAAVAKTTAPVVVRGETIGELTQIEVVTLADTETFVVTVLGAEGLRVRSPSRPVSEARLARGTSRVFTVRHQGSGRLIIRVLGRYRGARRVHSVSFVVGEARPPRAPGDIVVDSEGRRLKVLPARRR